MADRPTANGPTGGTTTGGTTTRPASLRRARQLPGGRAVVGALLVVAAAFGVFAVTAGADDTPSTTYIVITTSLPLGSTLTERDLRLEPIDLPPATAATSFTSAAEVIGAVTLAPLVEGQLLSASSVLLADRAGPASEAPSTEFSFSVERDHAVNGELQPGELVDVLATYTNAGEGYTDVVARSARLTSIDDGSSDSIATPGTIIVTLALTDPGVVLALAHAKETAAVTLVRTTRADAPLPVDRYRPDSSTADGERPGPSGSTSTSGAGSS